MRNDRPFPMSANEFPHGVFQWTLLFDLASFSIEQFQTIGLELPDNLRHAVKKRQIEFLCGRLCARACLESLGAQPTTIIGIGQDRAPIWPEHLLGSISHTAGVATALMGSRSQIEYLGIDIERLMAEATPQLIKHICCDQDELVQLAAYEQLSLAEALTVIFSGKESLFKALYPRVGSYWGFQGARIKFLAAQQLEIILTKDLHETLLSGRSFRLGWHRPGPNLIQTNLIQPHFPS